MLDVASVVTVGNVVAAAIITNLTFHDWKVQFVGSLVLSLYFVFWPFSFRMFDFK